MITFISLGPAAPKESNDRPVASLFLTIAKFPVVVPKQNNNATTMQKLHSHIFHQQGTPSLFANLQVRKRWPLSSKYLW
jgi:hypothetical protein